MVNRMIYEGEKGALRFLIEYELYKTIKLIKEGNLSNAEELIKESIDSFEARLPENLKKIENLHEFILEQLNDIENYNKQSPKTKDDEENER